MAGKPLQKIKTKKGAYHKSVQQRYGKRGFTKRGTIKRSIIAKDKKSTNPKLRKRATLAETYNKYRK